MGLTAIRDMLNHAMAGCASSLCCRRLSNSASLRVAPNDLLRLSISEVVLSRQRGSVRLPELVDAFAEQLLRWRRLNAYITDLSTQAKDQASVLDIQQRSDCSLQGVLIAIKDNFSTKVIVLMLLFS